MRNLFKRKQTEVDTESTGLDLEPVSEKPKKVNPVLVGMVVIALGGVLGWTLFSGGDDTPSQSTQEQTSNNVNTVSVSEDIRQLEAANVNNQKNSNFKATVMEEHDHNHDHEHGDVTTDGHSHSHGNISSNRSSQAQAPAPIQLTDEEKEALADAKEARSEEKARVKTRQKEDLDGSRSPIFFSITKPNQEMKETKKEHAQPTNANDYYNNYSKDDYISVVK